MFIEVPYPVPFVFLHLIKLNDLLINLTCYLLMITS